MVDPDIIDYGETLSKIGDQSQDFVIASHFIEHCEYPLGAIKSWCRVLRPNGVLFLVVPDRAAHFDKDRPPTVNRTSCGRPRVGFAAQPHCALRGIRGTREQKDGPRRI